jgi:hypothetical protein
MVIVLPDGKKQEVPARLEAIILWMLKQSDDITHGHKTIEVECHGKTVKPKITEHFDPIM